MSIAWSDRVWKYSRAKGSCLLVLLAVADNADEATGVAWPSVPYLARKVRLVPRAVQYNLRKLAELGELVVEERDGHSNRYRLALPTGEAGFMGAKVAGVNVDAPGGEPPCTGGDEPPCRGGMNVGSPITVIEPSVKRIVKEPLERTARCTRLPADFALTDEARNYAVGKGCRDPTRLFEDFCDYWRAKGGTMADWSLTLKRWVRSAHDGTAKPCGCQKAPPQPAQSRAAREEAMARVKDELAADTARRAANIAAARATEVCT